MTGSEETLRLGDRIRSVSGDLGGGLFHATRQLDDGGMRLVAKTYRPEYAGEFVRQWQRWAEARPECGIGLLGYLEAGTENGRPYLVRPWVGGESFDARARKLKLDPERPEHALAVGQAICRAVAGLHSVGLVHGHVTNANVFFGENGDPVVTDPWMGHPTAATIHLAAQLPGVRGGLAPEQQRLGGKVDARTDVWALGLLLARLYSRKPDIVVNERFLMELSSAKLPMQLIKVIWQAVREEPANRFADAGVLATALAEVSLADHQRTVYVRPVPPPATGVRDTMSPVVRNAALVAASIGGIATAAWFLGSGPVPPSPPAVAPVAVVPTPTPAATPVLPTPSPPLPELARLPSGVLYYDIKIGNGALVGPNDEIVWRGAYTYFHSAGFPDNILEERLMFELASRPIRTSIPKDFPHPAYRDGVPGMRENGVRMIALENRLAPKAVQDSWRSRGMTFPSGGSTVVLFEAVRKTAP